MVNALTRGKRLQAKAAFEDGYKMHKYDHMFCAFSGTVTQVPYYYECDRTFYHMAAKMSYGRKYVCFTCRRQTRSRSCCGIATTEKNPQREVPRQNNEKAWKVFERDIQNDCEDVAWRGGSD